MKCLPLPFLAKQVYADLTIMENFLSEYGDLNKQASKQLVDSFALQVHFDISHT